MSRYDKSYHNFQYQIFLNFDVTKKGIMHAKLFCDKWNGKNDNSSLLVNFYKEDDVDKLYENILGFLKQVDPRKNVRIYIHADGESKSNSIFGGGEDNEIEYKNSQVADFLARHFQKSGFSSEATINLIVCCYAEGILDSPAADLLQELNKRDVHSIVIARTMEVMAEAKIKTNDYDEEESTIEIKKYTCDKTGAEHMRPGSKISFRIKDGQIIAEDAYGLLWKKDVLLGIFYCSISTEVPEKKASLNILHSKFRQQAPHQVLKELKNVVNTKKSFIDEYRYSNFMESFFYKTETRKFLEKITEFGDLVLNNNSLETVTKKL